MLKAILFDLDGTLVDSNRQHALAWQQALGEAGHDIDLQIIAEQIGKGSDNLVPCLVPGASEADVERLGDAHGRIFKERFFSDLQPFPGARDLLARCRQAGYAVVLASSATAEELDHHLNVLDVRELIDAFTSADDVGCSKPCPDIFDTARNKAGVSATEALVVGDTPYDIAAADKAGIRTIAVRSGGFDDEKLSGALAIFDDVAELLARFDSSPLSRVQEAV